MEFQELSWRERGRLWIRLSVRLAAAAAALLFLMLAVAPLLSLFMPFVLAFLMAWLLNRPLRRLQQRLKLSRKLLSLLLILLSLAVVGGLLTWFVYSIAAEVYSLVTSWDTVGASWASLLSDAGAQFERLFALLPAEVSQWIDGLFHSLTDWLTAVVPELLASLGRQAGSFAMSVPSAAVSVVVFIMASYFIASDYPHIRLEVTRRLRPETCTFLSQVKHVAAAAFGGYVKAELILSVVVFFILLVGFTLTGQGYALLLAFLLAVMDFIPIIGAGTVMVPWAVIAAATGSYRTAIELMVIWGVIVLFRRVGEPKIVGDQTGLSPVLSLVSIYIGMRLGGVLGMILGPVLLLTFLNICKMGVFSGLTGDLRLALDDTRAFLAHRPKQDKR